MAGLHSRRSAWGHVWPPAQQDPFKTFMTDPGKQDIWQLGTPKEWTCSAWRGASVPSVPTVVFQFKDAKGQRTLGAPQFRGGQTFKSDPVSQKFTIVYKDYGKSKESNLTFSDVRVLWGTYYAEVLSTDGNLADTWRPPVLREVPTLLLPTGQHPFLAFSCNITWISLGKTLSPMWLECQRPHAGSWGESWWVAVNPSVPIFWHLSRCFLDGQERLELGSYSSQPQWGLEIGQRLSLNSRQALLSLTRLHPALGTSSRFRF